MKLFPNVQILSNGLVILTPHFSRRSLGSGEQRRLGHLWGDRMGVDGHLQEDHGGQRVWTNQRNPGTLL